MGAAQGCIKPIQQRLSNYPTEHQVPLGHLTLQGK